MHASSLDTALGKLILRLTVGGLMLFHGVHKILHPDSLTFIAKSLEAAGLPAMLSYGVFVGEVLAPLMIILGVMTRLGAMLIVVNMLFAIALVHADHLMLLTEHGGWRLELQAFFLFGALAIAAMGGGRFAVGRN
jgi:putative oxidoreductase